MKLAKKLVVLFLAVSIVPLAIAGFLALRWTGDVLREGKLEALEMLARERVDRLEGLCARRMGDVTTLARVPVVADALEDLTRAFSSGGLYAAEYRAAESRHAPSLTDLTEGHTVYELLLVSPAGDVVFMTARQRDLGSNLRTGLYKDTELAHAFALASSENRTVISGTGFYEPSEGQVIFLAAPVRKADRVVGVVAIQMSMKEINAIAGDYAGLGETGETSIVFAKNDQTMWVAPTRHDSGAALTRALRQGSDSANRAQQAARGKSGRGAFRDYRGVPVLAAWRPIPTLRLGLVIKMDEVEALAPGRSLTAVLLFLGLGTLVAALVVSLFIARSVSRPILDLTGVARQMADGDLSVRAGLGTGPEIGALGAAFNDMAGSLQRQNRLREGRNKLNERMVRMVGDSDVAMLADDIIACVAEEVGAQVGALFLAVDGQLRLAGRYAYRKHQGVPEVFSLGEGLVGQAAASMQPIHLNDVPEGYVLVGSALGQATARNILAVPFFFDQEVKGVIEVASLEPFAELHREFLNLVTAAVGIAVQATQSSERMKVLLEEAQRQTENLQAQQEALRVVNGELEEQTQRLKESEERLKAQQEELEVTNEELEEKNGLLEQQKREVERARKAVEEKAEEVALANRYKSEFLATMSHELRTPLNSLLLLAQGLAKNKEGNLTEDQLESARIIYSGGNDLLTLINEILDLSRIEAGRMELRLGPVLVGELADGVRASFEHMAKDKGIALEVTVCEGAPAEITSDHKRVEQVIRNLVANAVKFTETGSVTVTFGLPAPDADLSRSGISPSGGRGGASNVLSGGDRGASNAPSGGDGEHNMAAGCLAVAVKDTGVGVAPEHQRIIFEAFQQADSGTARKYGGTGLGLSISREIANLLGGEIQLESEPGKGSLFTLYLPTKAERPSKPDPGAQMQEVQRAQALVQSQVPDDRDAITNTDTIILVIEDDAPFAGVLLGKSHERGLKCLIASTGEVGLTLAVEHLPSAIILDIRLPGMDGWSVLSALKDDTRTRHIPVHVVSVHESSTESLRRGAVGHATKPLDLLRLEGVFGAIERVSTGMPKRLLVVENDPKIRRETVRLIGNGDVKVDEAGTGAEAMEALRSNRYDCLVLGLPDLGLPDLDGNGLIAKLEREGVALPPVIVHAARDLTRDEEEGLRELGDSIVIKDVRSQERLLDEVSLFLHRVVSKMSEKNRKIIRDLHDTDEALRGKSVLVVDDDMRTTFAVSRVLSERGMNPLKAESGERALRLLEAHPDVALVLMDIMMPGMDGYEAMRRIRAREGSSKLPIIALTAKAMAEDREKCLAAGANDYMQKPVDEGRLISMMRVWLCR